MKFLSLFRRKPVSRFGSAGISRQRETGAILIMPASLTGLQIGNEVAETALNLVSFVVRYFLEINNRLPDQVGETRGRARSDKFSREIDMEGEVTAATGGPMSYLISTACVPTNDVADFTTAGIILLDEVTVTQRRGEFRTAAFKLSSNPGLTAV